MAEIIWNILDIILGLAPEKFFNKKKTRTEKPDVGDDEVMMMKMEMSDTNREDDEMASWQTELLNGQSEQKR